MGTVAAEMKDLGWRMWCSLKDVVTKKTVQLGIAGWLAGIVCDRYGCDRAQLAAWGLTAIAMLQQAMADHGKNRR